MDEVTTGAGEVTTGQAEAATATTGTEPTTTTGEGGFYSGEVPKELEAQYKEMQGSYTRKMQELHNQHKSLRSGGSVPQPVVSQPTQNGSEADPFTSQYVQLESQVKEMRLAMLDQQIEHFAGSHPDVYEFATDMADAMMQVPGLTLEKAYWMIKGPKAEKVGMQKAISMVQQKATQPQGAPVGATNKAQAPREYKNLADAALDAYNMESAKPRG